MLKRTVRTKKRSLNYVYIYNYPVRDPISFVGGPWRATANLVRGRVFTMLYHSPPCTMWRHRH